MMYDKLIQMQPTSEMLNSINDLNMLRNNLLPIQLNSQQQFQQQNNALEQYLATIQYLTKQQAQNNLQNSQLHNLDNLFIQQHQLNQHLLNSQNNSNGNSPEHNNYVDVINNIPQQLLCLQQQQQRQQLIDQQIESNVMKNQAIKCDKQQQELLAKTLTNQITNQLNNQLTNQLNNQLNNVNYQQQFNNQQQSIIQHQSPPEKYTVSPLTQIAQMTVIDNKTNNIKCLDASSKKNEANKVSLIEMTKQSKSQQTFSNLPSKMNNNKRLAIEKSESRIETKNHSDQNNNSSNVPHNGIIGIDDQGKPFHNYIGLIAQAILKSKEKRLVLSEIYSYILDNYPYYKTRNSGWRNSIRHNLSLNDCFVKGHRAANGKGHYWSIHPANRKDFEKGDFRRRKAQRKVRKALGYSILDCRFTDEDQDSDDEELKRQFFSQFNHLQQLSNLHSLQNFPNNLYHLNRLSNLTSPSSTLATPQDQNNCQSIEGINSSEDYINYLAFVKRHWLNLNAANFTNPAFNNSNLKHIENLGAASIQSQQAQQYATDCQNNAITTNASNQRTKEEKKEVIKDKKSVKDEDDCEMVNIESESTVNKTSPIEKEKTVEEGEMIEVEMINEAPLNNSTKNEKVNCADESLKDDKSNDKLTIDIDLIKKMMNTGTYTAKSNPRKHKFDVDSILENERKNACY